MAQAHSVRILNAETTPAGVLHPELAQPESARVEVAPGAFLNPKSPPPKWPDRLSTAPEQQEEYFYFPHEKPTLVKPAPSGGSSSLIRYLLTSRKASDRTVDELMQGVEKAFNSECLAYEKFSLDLTEALADLQNNRENLSYWENLARGLIYLNSSMSFLIGLGVASSGGAAAPLGFALMTLGLAGAGNQAMADSGGWERVATLFTDEPEKQRSLARGFEVGTSAITTLGSVALGVQIAQMMPTNYDAIIKFVETTRGIFGATTTLARAFLQVDGINFEQKCSKEEEASEKHRLQMTTHATTVEAQADARAKALDQAARLLEAQQTKKRILADASAA